MLTPHLKKRPVNCKIQIPEHDYNLPHLQNSAHEIEKIGKRWLLALLELQLTDGPAYPQLRILAQGQNVIKKPHQVSGPRQSPCAEE